VVAALEASEDLNTDAIITALENTSADTIVGTIKIRPEDHQGMLGSYVAEAVKLDGAKYGAKVGWKTSTHLTWEQVDVTPEESGCKGF